MSQSYKKPTKREFLAAGLSVLETLRSRPLEELPGIDRTAKKLFISALEREYERTAEALRPPGFRFAPEELAAREEARQAEARRHKDIAQSYVYLETGLWRQQNLATIEPM